MSNLTEPKTAPVAAWDAPVLASVTPVIASSELVRTDPAAIEAVAHWMAFEEFPPLVPAPADPAPPHEATAAAIDEVMVTMAINFAYTDFDTGIPWSIVEGGVELVDADGMALRFRQAIEAGVPVLDGAYLAALTTDELGRVLHGPRPIPMLAERVEVLNAIGATLVDRYDGRFHNLVRSCAPRCFADGDGLIDRLTTELPHFDDRSTLHGHDIVLFKLVQLAAWMLYRQGLVRLDDIEALSAFPDYIVPAALRLMGVMVYEPELAELVDAGSMIEAGSVAENELRAHTVYATALLTDALNARRPPELRLAIPQLDYRLWSAYHAHIRPHHLTRTTMY
ncbi:MAG: queuosine salvage family protein [Actinomycetota bacterium]|nr:queuosine salvage family protein [Actinomycetota bacterium]